MPAASWVADAGCRPDPTAEISIGDAVAAVPAPQEAAARWCCRLMHARRLTSQLRVGSQFKCIHAGPRDTGHRVLELERIVRHPGAADVENVASWLDGAPIVLSQGSNRTFIDVIHEARNLYGATVVSKASRQA